MCVCVCVCVCVVVVVVVVLLFLFCLVFITLNIQSQYICNGAEWSKDKTQAAESIKWRPQQAYCSNQFLLVQPQTVFSTHPKSVCLFVF